MPIKIESKNISLEQLIDLMKYLKNLNVDFTLHIEIHDLTVHSS